MPDPADFGSIQKHKYTLPGNRPIRKAAADAFAARQSWCLEYL